MLMFGDASAAQSIDFVGQGKVFNLSSMVEGFVTLRYLIPPNNIGRFTDREFDIAYMNYVLGNDNVFMDFFQIIYELYIGHDVFIVAAKEDWSENILESLLKLIQQRYGYNSVFIGSEADYIYARNFATGEFVQGYGLFNLDQDKERFSFLYEQHRVNTGHYPFILEGWLVPDEDDG